MNILKKAIKLLMARLKLKFSHSPSKAMILSYKIGLLEYELKEELKTLKKK